MYNVSRAVDGKTVPFFHGSSVESFLVMLDNISDVSLTSWIHTEIVSHEIGSSSGISVFLTNSKVKASSSNATVYSRPGGVHVPITK